MNTPPQNAKFSASELRQRAEAAFRKNAAQPPEDLTELSPKEAQALLHELRVHQIELEMQNEELRAAQVRLTASQDRYFDLYDLAPVGYVTVTERGLVKEGNLTAASLLGAICSGLVKQPLTRFIHQEDQDIYYKLRLQLFKTGEPQQCNLRLVKQDGSTFWAQLSATAEQYKTGAPSCRIAITDITENKQMEEALRKSEEQYRLLFDAAGDMIFIHADKHRIQAVNSKASELLGWSSAELMSMSIAQLEAPEENASNVDDRIAEVMKHGMVSFETTLRHKNGSIVIAEVNSRKVSWNGHWAVMSIGRDITERKQMEGALEEKTAEMERFTYRVSHDLKSPLVTIKTFLGYLEKDLDAQKPELVSRDLGYIHGAADKMGEMLNEVLELARVGHNRNDIVQLPLQQVVQEALSLVAGQIAEREVQLQVTQEPVWLTGDKARLVEVFQNLVDNAVKFLGDQPDPKVEIGVEQVGGGVVIFVRDNGKGIDPRHLDKVFGLFEKLDASALGSGMGLAMVRRIVEIHGGKIWVQSEGLGHGTTFRFTLAETQFQTS